MVADKNYGDKEQCFYYQYYKKHYIGEVVKCEKCKGKGEKDGVFCKDCFGHGYKLE